MSEQKVYYCAGCGAPLDVQLNRPIIFCQFCGCKNEIAAHAMNTNFDIGNISVQGKTDVENLLSSVEFVIANKDYDKANEMLLASMISGVQDYRIYILKARIDLMKDDNKSLFECLEKLREQEKNQSSAREVTKAICELMQFRGLNGVIPLHNATFHELMDMVEFCVEHGSDVNCVAGMNRVTPISIMFVHISPTLQKLDGTPFIRDKKKVKQIRRYLMSKGARDSFRFGY